MLGLYLNIGSVPYFIMIGELFANKELSYNIFVSFVTIVNIQIILLRSRILKTRVYSYLQNGYFTGKGEKAHMEPNLFSN